MNPYGKAFVDMLGAQPLALDSPQVDLPPAAAPQAPHMSKGQMILGILADALSGAAGQQGHFAQMLGQQRQQAAEDAQWTRRQQSELGQFQQQEQIRHSYDKPDVSPMERDLNYWRSLDPAGQDAYRSMQAAKPQFIPDGMGGGQWAVPPGGQVSGMPKPVGKLTPINGGPTPPASGNFPR